MVKPGLIGALGSWVSGGVEFNWPYHHQAARLSALRFRRWRRAPTAASICWLSEHDPIDRMKGTVGVVLRPGVDVSGNARASLCNRTPVTTKSFLWWENAAVPVNEQYQIFFPKDVTYVNFHYLDSRASYPVAGDTHLQRHRHEDTLARYLHGTKTRTTPHPTLPARRNTISSVAMTTAKQCGVVHIGGPSYLAG